MIYNSECLEALSDLVKELESDFDIKFEFELSNYLYNTFECRVIKDKKCIKVFSYPEFALAKFILDLQKFTKELEEKRRGEVLMFKVTRCIGEFEEVFRFMRELENRFQIKFNIQKDVEVAKLRIEAICCRTNEAIEIFEYHFIDIDQLESDMKYIEKKLIEKQKQETEKTRRSSAEKIVTKLQNWVNENPYRCLYEFTNDGGLRIILINAIEGRYFTYAFNLDGDISDKEIDEYLDWVVDCLKNIELVEAEE